MASRQPSVSLDPAVAQRRQTMTEARARTHKMAVEEEKVLKERMKKNGTEDQFPNYKFIDYIGKGTYGRVYRAYDYTSDPPREVAIKLMNLDDVDYLANPVAKDEALNEVRQEISVLMQLKDHGVQNVNLIHDVLEIDGLLWLVCEYCPGGSLRTLLRASNSRCEEKYIRVIARELAIALQSIHEANVIHRDLKAANVMIHEKGALQVIDFGVAGVLESKIDKRGTIIGTPNWMPPEQHRGMTSREGVKYGFEVDVWSYISTIFEIAEGKPPHANMPPSRLATALRTRPPRLKEPDHPRELCEFVEFVGQVKPEDRPTVQAILQHPYIRGTELTHPTNMLRDLYERFVIWEFGGGQRHSLFMPTGAMSAAEFSHSSNDRETDFIFSTSRDPFSEFDQSYDPFEDSTSRFDGNPAFALQPASGTPTPSSLDDFSNEPPDDLTTRPSHPSSQRNFDNESPGMEKRIERGGQALGAIFNEQEQPYEYGIRTGDMPLDKPILNRAKSDLPLRDSNDQSGLARKEVDFDESAASRSGVEIADADTIKQKRKQPPKEKRDTMAWQADWGDIEANMNLDADVSPGPPSAFPMARPALLHAETAPDKVAQARASTATMNLDDMMGDDDWLSGSALGKSPGFVTPVEDQDIATRHNITDLTESAFPAYASSVADTSASEDDLLDPEVFLPNGHTRGRKSAQHPSALEDIAPPHPAAMRDESDQDDVRSEIRRLLEGVLGELAALGDEYPAEDDIHTDHSDDASEDGDAEDSDLASGQEA